MAGKLIVVEEAGSTQDLAREMALNCEPEGTAVMALRQTKGRGRTGRAWVSPTGRNLALSLILRPNVAPREAPLLGLLAAVGVAETLERCGVRRPLLKWPNDVLVCEQKIAGIISEGTIMHQAVPLVIIGVGLNVNSELDDFPQDLRGTVTSLFLCTGERWPLEDVATSLLDRVGALYERVKMGGCGFIVPLWESRWAHRGRLLVRSGIQGTAERISNDGTLILRTADNQEYRVSSGEALPVE